MQRAPTSFWSRHRAGRAWIPGFAGMTIRKSDQANTSPWNALIQGPGAPGENPRTVSSLRGRDRGCRGRSRTTLRSVMGLLSESGVRRPLGWCGRSGRAMHGQDARATRMTWILACARMTIRKSDQANTSPWNALIQGPGAPGKGPWYCHPFAVGIGVVRVVRERPPTEMVWGHFLYHGTGSRCAWIPAFAGMTV